MRADSVESQMYTGDTASIPVHQPCLPAGRITGNHNHLSTAELEAHAPTLHHASSLGLEPFFPDLTLHASGLDLWEARKLSPTSW